MKSMFISIMEKEGKEGAVSDRCEINRQIKERNARNEQLKEITEQIVQDKVRRINELWKK